MNTATLFESLTFRPAAPREVNRQRVADVAEIFSVLMDRIQRILSRRTSTIECVTRRCSSAHVTQPR